MKEENEIIQELRERIIISEIKEKGVFETDMPKNEVRAVVAKLIKVYEENSENVINGDIEKPWYMKIFNDNIFGTKEENQ